MMKYGLKMKTVVGPIMGRLQTILDLVDRADGVVKIENKYGMTNEKQ